MNLWLLQGDPLTLVDTGPRSDEALAALEAELAAHGFAVEDIELLLLTHHHLDHTGLRPRSGSARARASLRSRRPPRGATATTSAPPPSAASRERLLAAHGVPARLVADTEPFLAHIVRGSADFETDVVLADGDEIRAGGRTLRVVYRPGHSTTDTLFVDETSSEAFVGDHLLAKITSGAEVMPVGAAGGRAPPGAARLPRRPAADRGDAARRRASPVTARRSTTPRG